MTAVPSALALGRIRPPQPNVDSDIELDRNSNLSLEVTRWHLAHCSLLRTLLTRL
jgi:hypothetical protein